MHKKINYILTRNQKIKFVFLVISIIIGSLWELVGVSAMLPLITVILDESAIHSNDILGKIYYFGNFNGYKSFVLFLLVVIIIIYILKNLYITFMNSIQFKYTCNNQRIISTRLMESYLNQPYIYHLSKNSAELLNNIVVNVSMFFQMLLAILHLLTDLSVCIVLGIYLAYTDITITLGITVIIGVLVLIFLKLTKTVLHDLGKQNIESSKDKAQRILQTFGAIKEIKVSNKEAYFAEFFDESAKRNAQVYQKFQILSMLPKPMSEVVCILALLITIGFKICFSDNIANLIPTLTMFVMAAYRLIPSFGKIASSINEISFNKSAVDSVYCDLREIADMKNTLDKQNDLVKRNNIQKTIAKAIEVRNLSFHYPESEVNVLEDVNIVIRAKQSTAFIGTSGAGKTTLIDIILGILEPQRGAIIVDGLDIKNNMKLWQNSIGYIPQSIYLLDDTIRNNIALGIKESDIDSDKLSIAIQKAQLATFIASLENGLETIVGEQGVRLSGGQKQRIGIARALYHNPAVLVLDEATSALDMETEAVVMETIENLSSEKTLLIIAHRLSTIRNCDAIYEISEGKAIKKDIKRFLEKI